jgi:hypothetical protein
VNSTEFCIVIPCSLEQHNISEAHMTSIFVVTGYDIVEEPAASIFRNGILEA